MKLFTYTKSHMHFVLIFMFAITLMAVCTDRVQAQPSTANYTFTHITNDSLTDMSSGAKILIPPGVGYSSSAVSPLRDIGFDFYFMGERYTRFSTSVNGFLRLGEPIGGGGPDSNSLNDLNRTDLLPIIAPFWNFLIMQEFNFNIDSKGVRYKVSGSAPGRVLTIEWNGFIRSSPSLVPTPVSSTFQLRLYETSGKIEFVYGQMIAQSPPVRASIGFSAGE